MKKFLPIIVLLVGVLVFLGVYLFVVRPAKKAGPSEEQAETLPEISFIDRPMASLTPTADGHWLNLKVQKILKGSDSMDYELLYSLPDGRTQGVPGTITLKGASTIERKLLLGSESSGKFRYDEGVKEGTLTLRFRDSGGKLKAKFSTKFQLISRSKELSSPDGKFTATLQSLPTGFFVVMETFGIWDAAPAEILAGPYGIFSSNTSKLSASVKMDPYKVYRHITGPRWSLHNDGDDINDSDTHIFVGTSK